MGTILKRANAMPAPTWHRLRMNDVDIEVPRPAAAEAAAGAAGPAGEDAPIEDSYDVIVEAVGAEFGEDGAFEAAVAGLQARLDAARAARPADTRAVIAAAAEEQVGNLDLPALSAYERRAVQQEVAQDVAAAFECGLGADAEAYIEGAAGGRAVVVCGPSERAQVAVRVAGTGADAVAAADVDVVARPGADVALSVEYDSPAAGEGAAAVRLRVFAGAGARVDVDMMQTLDAGWTALDASGFVLDDGARVRVTHRILGAKASYTGLSADLRGEGSSIDIDTRYVGHGANAVDFNYIVRHRGRDTACNLNANGVLLGESRKVLRGTIDLVHGCKGSEGTERDTVLIADERAQNKTVPVILCDEDDVAGNHGATIGHVRREQMNYLQSRGLSPEAAEGLFATAALEEAAAHAPSAAARAGVVRIASGLDVPFTLDADEDENEE